MLKKNHTISDILRVDATIVRKEIEAALLAFMKK